MRQDSPENNNQPFGAQIVQVETLGKMGLVLFAVLTIAIVGLAFYTGRTDGIGEARAENLATQVRLLNAEVQILKSEFNKTQAQLLTQGVIKNPHQ